MIDNISATVLFVEDLPKCTTFYRDTLGLQVTFNDDNSFGFRLGDHDFLLLKFSTAADMISAEAVSLHAVGGHRVLLCAGVKDIDAAYKALTAKGISFIKPPQSQAWGRRTAYFADPEGNLWEIWQHLVG